MRLVQLKLTGYRRFEKAAVYLDRKVVALVGPNEAGKTSLLEALASFENEDEIQSSDITRGKKVAPDETVLELRFELEPHERSMVDSLECEGSPTWYVLSKHRNGSVVPSLQPPVRRGSFGHRTELAALIEELDESEDLTSIVAKVVAPEQKQQPNPSLRMLFAGVRPALESDAESLSTRALGALDKLENGIKRTLADSPSVGVARLTELLDRIGHCRAVEADHPADTLLEDLEEGRPRLKLFGSEDRTLQSEYPIGAAANPPPALRNLLELAGLGPRKLAAASQSHDHGQRAAYEEEANQRLKTQFEAAWRQSRIYPRIQLDEQKIRVHVRTARGYRPIAERSDGLRSFVALAAFSHSKVGSAPVILLVDEAEEHLHYDAQADLVSVFYAQDAAANVLYSTHSAGCLPRDLGTDVRIVEALRTDDGGETDRSLLRNEFWTTAAGFSPLMLAMGASVFAMCPTRRAVIAEGPSETVLLPTLLREANDRDELGLQVAPGLANVSRRDVADLVLEAPRVAYYLDGDDAGRVKERMLRTEGVPREEIVRLRTGRVLEDLILKKHYAAAVNRELRRSHGDIALIEPNDLEGGGRLTKLDEWCARQGVPVPPKVRVAQHLVDLVREKAADHLLTNSGTRALRRVFEGLARALGMQE